jgi:WD40 repeat protein
MHIVHLAKVTPDGKYAVLTDANRDVTVWTVSLKLVRTFKSVVRSDVQFSMGGKMLAMMSKDNTFCIRQIS